MHSSIILLLGGCLLLLFPTSSKAQVGLRTAPLTAPQSRDKNGNNSSPGVFPKWPLRHKSNHSSNIESSLAAIFRGVAYGISTTPSSTTTSTTTPIPTFLTKSEIVTPDISKFPSTDERDFGKTFLYPPRFDTDVQHKAVTDQRGFSSILDNPIQTPYIEDDRDIIGMLDPYEFGESDHTEKIEVVRADVGTGLSKVEWVRSLGTAWIVHVYCTAGLYSLLAMLALLWLARIHATPHLLPKGYYITLFLLMFLASFLRCVHLFYDPYGAERRLPEVLSIVVEELGWPCLTAGLAVVVLAIVRAWRCPRLLPQKPLAPLALALLTAVHLLTAITAHLTAALLPDHAAPLRAAARAVTAAWGGAVGIGAFLASWRVARAVGRHSGLLLIRVSRASTEGTLPSNHPRVTLFRGSILTVVASFGLIVLSGLHMYALVGPHFIFDMPPVYPWYWLAYQSTCRVLEIIMWLILGITASLSVGASSVKRQSQKDETKLFSILSCNHCCSCTSITTQDKAEEVFPAVCQTNQAVRNFTLQSSGKGVYQEALTQQPLARRASTIKATTKRPSIRKSATLHSGTSDIQLLWNQGHPQSAVSSDAPSRPSSMLFNDAGFVRFRMHVDPQQCVEEVFRKSLQNLDKQCDPDDSTLFKKIPTDDPPTYDQSFYENATNNDILKTPSRSKSSSHFENHYDNAQFDHQLLNKQIKSDLYFDRNQCKSDVASITDCSSTDAMSPVPAADNEWSKYASTCSSISAANSFDVRMYDDFDVSTYYNSPSPASSNVYASLHRPTQRSRFVNHWALYGEEKPGVHGYEARHAVEQLTALLAPHTSSASSQSDLHIDYTTDGSHSKQNRGSDSDACSSGSQQAFLRHERDADHPVYKSRCPPLSAPRHFNIHNITPDSAVVLDYTGHTDEASGDDIENTLPFRQPSHPRPGLLNKIVKNNFSLNNSGYSPLSSEDVYNLPYQHPHNQNPLVKQAHHQAMQQQFGRNDRTEKVRPCGHRPRKSQKESPNAISPTKFSMLDTCKYESDQPNQKRKLPLIPNSPEKREHHKKLPSPVTDGTTQTDIQADPSLSPSSSRPPSSLASHSDLPSECVDSEDDTHCADKIEQSDHDATPDVSPVNSWLPSNFVQEAV